MIRVLAQMVDPNSASSYYRSAWPLGRLVKAHPDVQVTVNPPSFEFHAFSQTDILFMHAPFTPGQSGMLQMAKEAGAKIWLDFDDDVESMTPDNSHFSTFSHPQVLQNMRLLASLADVVTVSTLPIAERYSLYSKDIRIIPNAFDDMGPLLKRRHEHEQSKGVISWRAGGNSHMGNIQAFASQMALATSMSDSMRWRFFGVMPWPFTDLVDQERYVYFPEQPLMRYIGQLQEAAPQVHFVALKDTAFNRAKSNIALIEAVYAGASVLAPEWHEWDVPGVVYYGQNELADALARATESLENSQKRASLSWAYVMDNLRLSKINEARYQILVDLMDSR